MEKLLRLKHWQIFTLLVALPIVCEVMVFSTINTGALPITVLVLLFVLAFVFSLVMGWTYALGTHLHTKLPPSADMNIKRFRTLFFIPVVYIICLIVMFAGNELTGEKARPWIVLIILPMHLFSMFCMFYTLYFNSKSLKAVELQRDVTFSDYAGEFFLIWFFPIGIWFIQPRINKIFESNQEDHTYPSETLSNI